MKERLKTYTKKIAPWALMLAFVVGYSDRHAIGSWILGATANMGLDLPTPGVTTGPGYASQIVTAFETIDTHDHTSGKGVQVPSAGLNINADVDFKPSGTAYGPANVKYVDFDEQASTPAGANRLWSDTSGDLYWRDDNSNDVQITSGASLDASTIGGFGGDYTTTDAVANYSDTTKSYSFLQDDSPDELTANIVGGNIDYCEPGTASVNCVTLASPTSLASAYTITWPTALPSNQSAVEISSTGALSQVDAFGTNGIFGDGSDGDADFDGVNTFAFSSEALPVYTLTEDVYLDDVECQDGVTIITAGYRMFIRGTLTLYGDCSINNDGADGSDGGAGGGAAGSGGSGTASMGAGSNGGAGGNNGNGSAGTAASNMCHANAAGDGGDSDGGRTGGSAGGATKTIREPRDVTTAISWHMGANSPFAGGPGGGGGAGGDSAGDRGGGGGGGGGSLMLAAWHIDTSTQSWTGTVSVNGGDGGPGDSAGADSAGGGGGAGGCVAVLYNRLTGTLVAGTDVTAAGGAGGTGKAPNGQDGDAGGAGLAVVLDVKGPY